MTTATLKSVENSSKAGWLPLSLAEQYMEALKDSPGGDNPTHPCRMLADDIASRLRVADLSGKDGIDLGEAVRDVVTLASSINEFVIDLREG